MDLRSLMVRDLASNYQPKVSAGSPGGELTELQSPKWSVDGGRVDATANVLMSPAVSVSSGARPAAAPPDVRASVRGVASVSSRLSRAVSACDACEELDLLIALEEL